MANYNNDPHMEVVKLREQVLSLQSIVNTCKLIRRDKRIASLELANHELTVELERVKSELAETDLLLNQFLLVQKMNLAKIYSGQQTVHN